MPKRRRNMNSPGSNGYFSPDKKMKDHDVVWMARGRLKGALLEALDPNSDDGDSSTENISMKDEKHVSSMYSPGFKRELNYEISLENSAEKSDKRKTGRKLLMSPHKANSYVMKLFDRSVDLAQFQEDTPLYPICRAWMANQPRNNFRPKSPEPETEENSEHKVDLPPPEGPLVARVPPLLPEQCQYNKEDINFDYNQMLPPSKEELLEAHKIRWTAIRRNWLEQSILYEARYAKTQDILREMDTNA